MNETAVYGARTKGLPPLLQGYYSLKPLVPRSVQLALRRLRIGAKRTRTRGVWPISESAGRAPAGWQGWPDGKKFAVVLTHDVERESGLEKCRALMRAEMTAGVRSSFGLVCGRYSVPRDLRDEMTREGFEVSVHGYMHDGKLFSSRSRFEERAAHINAFLGEWNAVGFRSPAMHSNLEWLGDLDITYDSSTFDTDPFEPCAQGVNTIFPFHVPRKSPGLPYVELPYTLPQDFTLFVLMHEQAPDIWKRKLDWIVERGGMVLLNTHPDYMCMNGDACGREQYPVAIYEAFLAYLNERYGGQFWHALPREVASFCRELPMLSPPRKPLRVCMPVYSFYEMDNRVIRYAETLAARGDRVDVVSLRNGSQPRRSVINGVHVHRIQSRKVNEKGKAQYLYRLLKFFMLSSLWVSWKSLRGRFDVVHVHSVPDFEVFAAWVPKLAGTRIILDIHDLVPEFYAAKFHTSRSSRLFRLLLVMERWSASFADHVIAANHLWYETLVSRAVAEARCSAIPNYVDLNVFGRRPRTRVEPGAFRLVYAGGIQEHQGLDVVLRAMGRLRGRIPGLHFDIHGSGKLLDQLVALAEELELGEMVRIKEPVSLHGVPEVLAQADLGVVPKRAEGFSDEAFSTKIFELMFVRHSGR